MACHLVILKKHYINAILDGSKTIESRLYKKASPPFGKIKAADTLLLKASSGPVCAAARVSSVESFENLCPSKIKKLKIKYNRYILGDDQYWQSKSQSRFAVFVHLKSVRTLVPVRINKKDWRAWVILEPGRDFGLLEKYSLSPLS